MSDKGMCLLALHAAVPVVKGTTLLFAFQSSLKQQPVVAQPELHPFTDAGAIAKGVERTINTACQ